ncbi:hypothetical protein [Celeribacter sp. ULVN23_4]
MPLDSSTEIIAHFIGMLHQFEEASRLRQAYEEMRAAQQDTSDPADLLKITINVSSPDASGGYEPSLKYSLPQQVQEVFPWLTGPAQHYAAPIGVHIYGHPTDILSVPKPYLNMTFEPSFYVPPPSAQAGVHVQMNVLEDNDIFSNVDYEIAFATAEDYAPMMAQLTQIAEALQIAPDLVFPENETAMSDTAFEISGWVQTLEGSGATPCADGVQISLLFGAAAMTLVVNGEEVEDVATFQDSLPPALQAEEDEEAEDLGVTSEDGPTSDSGHFASAEDAANAEPDGPLHEITLGQNLMINEAIIQFNWLDAPVWLVAGDYLELDVISQVHVWHDVDFGADDMTAGASALPAFLTSSTEEDIAATPWAGTEAISIAEISREITTPEPGAEEAESDGTEAELSPAAYIEVVTFSGNLINTSHIQQINLVSDFDQVTMEITAAETYLQMGDNTVVNVADLMTLGFYYDVIVVGGNVIDLTMISQTNVMLDGDQIHVGDGFGGELIGGSNLMWNEAHISETGLDTSIALEGSYAKDLKDFSKGEEDASSDLLNDPALLGVGVLRVLYVEGDVINMHCIEQTNVLGDADQIALIAEGMLSQMGDDVCVTTGQNAQGNLAIVNEGGMDSTIHVGGESYSDALIYQAEFVSEDDPLMPMDTSELASEAVAFLSDDMMNADGQGDGAEGPVIAAMSQDGAQADVMHIT